MCPWVIGVVSWQVGCFGQNHCARECQWLAPRKGRRGWRRGGRNSQQGLDVGNGGLPKLTPSHKGRLPGPLWIHRRIAHVNIQPTQLQAHILLDEIARHLDHLIGLHGHVNIGRGFNL